MFFYLAKCNVIQQLLASKILQLTRRNKAILSCTRLHHLCLLQWGQQMKSMPLPRVFQERVRISSSAHATERQHTGRPTHTETALQPPFPVIHPPYMNYPNDHMYHFTLCQPWYLLVLILTLFHHLRHNLLGVVFKCWHQTFPMIPLSLQPRKATGLDRNCSSNTSTAVRKGPFKGDKLAYRCRAKSLYWMAKDSFWGMEGGEYFFSRSF